MWGPHCDQPCPGGSGSKACNAHGQCLDGPTRTKGACLCNWAWRGRADCSFPWGGIGLGVGLGLVGIVVSVWAYKRFRERARELFQTHTRLKNVAGELDVNKELLRHQTEEVSALQEAWRIDPATLQIDAFVAAGGEGRVYRGTWRSQFEVAVKMMKRDANAPEEWGFSNSEVKTMQRLRGSRLVHFYGVGHCILEDPEDDGPDDVEGGHGGLGEDTRVPTLRKAADDDDEAAAWDFVVLEFLANGSLNDEIRRRADDRARHGTPWPWSTRLRVLKDVAEGMSQMHAKRYVHRDLKTANVLIDGKMRCKIADLGLSRKDDAFKARRDSAEDFC